MVPKDSANRLMHPFNDERVAAARHRRRSVEGLPSTAAVEGCGGAAPRMGAADGRRGWAPRSAAANGLGRSGTARGRARPSPPPPPPPSPSSASG
jgi:hypothetical protein